MKLECSIEKLKNALHKVERVAGKNLSLPVLSSILLVASNKNFKIRATNLSLGVEIEIPAKIEIEGTTAVNGQILSGVFSNISKDDNVLLDLSNGNLSIKTRNNNILIKSDSFDDFPTLPTVKENCFTINSQKIVDGIKSVYYSGAVSDIKPEFASVYIYSIDNNLVFVSTDSFRLAEKKIKIKGIDNIGSILIPIKNVSEILRLLGDNDTDIKVCFNKNQISFFGEDFYITSKVIDGIFPDYKQIIPKEFQTEVVVLKEDFINSLKISNIFSDKFNQINLIIRPKSKIFELNSKNIDVGENNTRLEAALKGEDIELSFNYKYLLDCFQSIGSDSLTLYFNGANRPIIIRGISDESFMYLVMPMNR